MSYCRLGPGCDLYIYSDGRGSLHCCMCALGPPDFSCVSGKEMVEHVRKHQAAGHDTPEGLEEELLGEDDRSASPEKAP